MRIVFLVCGNRPKSNTSLSVDVTGVKSTPVCHQLIVGGACTGKVMRAVASVQCTVMAGSPRAAGGGGNHSQCWADCVRTG